LASRKTRRAGAKTGSGSGKKTGWTPPLLVSCGAAIKQPRIQIPFYATSFNPAKVEYGPHPLEELAGALSALDTFAHLRQPRLTPRRRSFENAVPRCSQKYNFRVYLWKNI
jgi:hypothetical protein